MSFIDRIRWQCRLRPENPALLLPGAAGTVTYGRLAYHLNSVCRRLNEIGIVPGTVYGLLVDDALLHIVFTLALEELGAGTVVLHDMDIPQDWNLGAVFTDRESVNSERPMQRVHVNWLHGDGDDLPSRHIGGRSPDDICRIVLTSGSTGKPKAVVFTHRTVERRLAVLEFAFGSAFARHTRILCCMALATNIGYRFFIRALARGGMFCFPDSILETTVRKIESYKIQNLVASAATLAEFLAVADADRKRFRSLELILTGGSLLPRTLADKLRATMCSRVVNWYGVTEPGTVASAPVEALDLDNGEVGFVIPGVQTDFVDPETRAAVKAGGTLRIRSDAVALGYFGDNGETESFEDDAFYTADLGYLSPDRCLSIHGRSNNVINLGGDKITLERAESLYSAAPGVHELAAAAIPDAMGVMRLVAVVVPDTGWSEQLFLNHCRNTIERPFWPSRIVMAEHLPRAASGKIDRRMLEVLVSAR